jgi:hypothetical protein
MGFSMGVYCDLMGINRIFDGICWDIYIFIYSLVGGKTTPLKNISQWEELSHILWKIKHVPYHQPAT